MENEQAGQVALSWADEFIKGLLAEEEKYQEVIKDLSTEAILATTKKLDVTSEEFRTGADILGERAFGALYRADDEATAGFDDETFITITETEVIYKEVDDGLGEKFFDIDRELDRIRREVEDASNRQLDELRESNEGILGIIGGWLSDATDTLHNTLWGWLPELTSDTVTYLFSLPAMILFESFKNFFFEETE